MDFDRAKHLIEESFNGKYEVIKFLGEGSFAEVYLVRHNFLKNLMAMKIIKEPLNSTTNLNSIFQEVQLAIDLRHENIIAIYDAGIMAGLDEDSGINRAYFLMEYVPGGDLQQYLNSYIDSDLLMPVKRVLNLIRQILEGLNTLHSANPPIIHRDLKLNNILLSYDTYGEIVIKISDFGFAKQVTKGLSDIDIAGTRPYMAPECFRKVSSTMSDIYAIGVIFYQLLTNRYPYRINEFSIDEMLDLKPWDNDLVPASEYNDKVIPQLDEIIARCLDIDPKNRYHDAFDFLEDVENVIDKYKSKNVLEDSITGGYVDEYSEYIINDSLKKAFFLAKCENRLDEAVEILEGEVLQDYDIRKCYGETLRMWKSQRPDIKLISNAFTVNLKGENYQLSCNLLKEAIAYNPSIKHKYSHYIDLWEIFIDLAGYGNLIKAVISLEDLMRSNRNIAETYSGIINTLRTYSVEEIITDAIRLANLNRLADAANLMEFAVVSDIRARVKYSYKMSLWKQNMKLHLKMDGKTRDDTIDFAVDLGTTDSLISYFNGGNPVIIKNYKTGDDFTPSAVLIDKDDNVFVGQDARNALIEDSGNAVSEFKHNMGFPVPFKFEKSERIMLPEELSAEVLKELRVSVYRQYGIDIEHIVICVPANSNPIKTKAVNDAANLAGFRSYHIILEPVAVGLAYNLQSLHGTWMIYDLGGGTFNVSLLKDSNGEIEKIATAGLDNLGGNSFDWAIVDEIFVPKIAEDLNPDGFKRQNPKYRRIFSKLKNAAETAKKDLSRMQKADIFIYNLFEGYDFEYYLTEEVFKETITPFVKSTLALSRNLLDENSLLEEDIDKIILVGGSSLSPAVKELLSGEFEIPLEDSIDPLTVVSRGAAIYAGSLEKPEVDLKTDDFSLTLSSDGKGYSGCVFNRDDKFSFLGYELELKDSDNEISHRIPICIDGKFKAAVAAGRYEIRLYRGDELIELDEKSPDVIDGESIHIPFLAKTFSLLEGDLTTEKLIYKYVNQIKAIDYLNEYACIGEIEVLDYIARLVEIAKRDKSAKTQTLIYLDYLENIVDAASDDLEFNILLENVENKLDVAYNRNLFETDEFKLRLDEICKDRNYDELNRLYVGLIERYVELNSNDVIVEVFFNLRYDGLFTTNKRLADEFIKDGLSALNSSDYTELFEVVKKLYEIDERNYMAK